MKNIFEDLKAKGKLESLKQISMKEFYEYVNKYIAEGLEIGGKYDTNGYGNIHYIIKENIKKGLHELYSKYNIDYSFMFDYISVGTWRLKVTMEFKEFYFWEEIGSYDYKGKKRRNASFYNTTFTLTELPKFEMWNGYEEIENLYKFLNYLFDEKKAKVIGNLESEIATHKKQIAELNKKIKNLKKQEFSIDILE